MSPSVLHLQTPNNVSKCREPKDLKQGFMAIFMWTILVMAFCLTPVADFLTVKAASGSEAGARYSLFFRGLLLGALLFTSFFFGKIKLKSCVTALLAIIPICAATVMVLLGQMTVSEFGEQVIFVSKIFTFFVYAAAIACVNDQKLLKLEKIMLAGLMVYASCIIIGAIFSIEIFRSYQANTQIRSGYKGLVFAQNEASALMVAGLGYTYLNLLQKGWRFFTVVPILALIFASLLIGTKAAAIGAIAVMCAYFFARYSMVGAAARTGSAVAVLLGIAIVAFFTVPAIRDAATLSQSYFQYHYERATDNAILTILLSGRNQKLAQVWSDIAHSNYSFAFTGGYPITRYFVEIDIPDLVFCLGLPVFSVYFFKLFREFSFPSSSKVARYGRLFFFVLLALACTAGHTLNSAVTSPYLAFIAVLIRRRS
jgi:hypothetical protein